MQHHMVILFSFNPRNVIIQYVVVRFLTLRAVVLQFQLYIHICRILGTHPVHLPTIRFL